MSLADPTDRTMVHECGPSAESFALSTLTDDEPVCAAEGCMMPPEDHLSVTLAADYGGTLADFGDVGFCTPDCAESFLARGALWVDDEDLQVFWTVVTLAEIRTKGHVIDQALGHSVRAATEAAAERIDTQVHEYGYEVSNLELSFRRLGPS